MKSRSLAALLALISLSMIGYSQSEPISLDGNVYKVETWELTESDKKTPEELIFANGIVDAPVCQEYGFYASEYDVYVENGETRFSFVSQSEYEGEIYFDGVVKDSTIEGTYTWKREGQKDLKYIFKGSLK